MSSFLSPSTVRCTLGLVAAFAACAAKAHVALEYQVAPAGSTYKANFRIGHGCGDSPTRQVSVAIPEGVGGARPMPKPGWSVDIRRAPLAQPLERHGTTVREDVSRITWTARTPADMLPADHADEFVLVAQMPRTPGTVYWALAQLCESGRYDWAEVPKPGQPAGELKQPAPRLDILPSASPSGHSH